MMTRRLILLFPGLALYGLSTALMVRADLGLNPWNVLHQGLSRSTGYSIGTIIVVVGIVLLLAWIPLRQWPGLGTVSNVMLIGVTADASLALLPTPQTLPLRLLALVAAIALNGLATGMYIGAGLGAGPRDGLMTGISARTGCSIRFARTLVEVTALALGWLLGGTLGLGTVLYAVAIGPVIQVVLPAFQRWRERGAAAVATGKRVILIAILGRTRVADLQLSPVSLFGGKGRFSVPAYASKGAAQSGCRAWPQATAGGGAQRARRPRARC